MPSKFLVYLLLFTFPLYCLTGCSGQEIIRPAAENQISFTDLEQFPVKKETLYSSCIQLLQERGYIIDLSDPETGLISAQFSSSSLIDEEEQEPGQPDNTCINILSFILLVGVIFLIISALSSGSDGSDEGCDYLYEEESFDTEAAVSSYRYDLMLMISSVDTGTSACRLTLIRSDIENGTAVSQTNLKSKAFNFNFFSNIRKKLVI